jgi:electron transport protein HydN
MGNKFVMADPGQCIGCGTCLAACMMEHPAIDGVPIPRMTLVKTLTVSVPVGCHHCQDAPCVASCPEHALYIVDESVKVDQSRCIGCSSCVLACPYGAIDIVLSNRAQTVGGLTLKTTKKPVVIKCDLCATRAAGPACISACLTNSLTLVDSDFIDETSRKKQVRAARSAELVSSFALNQNLR